MVTATVNVAKGCVYHASWTPPDLWSPDSAVSNEDYDGMRLVSNTGRPLRGQPKLASRGSGKLDVFVAAAPRIGDYFLEVLHSTWDGQTWSAFKNISSFGHDQLFQSFNVAQTGSSTSQVQLVAYNASAYMSRTTYSGSDWSGWQTVPDDEEEGGFITSNEPLAVSTGKGTDYFGLRYNGTIARKSWDGSKYNPPGTAWDHINGTSEDGFMAM
ncbi:hypothetical protein BAUCODRAFT_247200 [Baudoinia panamericana UAMH 10762]|uniref:Fucose-specific lectin n=1 Tax=Baudoinia panamericana (strain UAMH 10762) TaxID=717646 RepID=M2N3M8_BAUPA|nr:uncharacterized protein BAUCODRAFT_247200 [Baudoinia panamericana UAMH 10762]EMC93609.1 hypothetical protein BAUCODRAFT_247200 [Baudoinia panamericana UAMH 10762]